MRNIFFLLVFTSLGFISCDTNTPLKIYVKTTAVTQVDGEENRTDSITVVNSDYFEVDLCSLTDPSKGYHARKDIEKPTSIENFRSVFFYITQENGTEIYFKNSTEFLNFMSERNYEMIDQSKRQYCTDYTFKKKK